MKYILLSFLLLYVFYKIAKWILRWALRMSFQELMKVQARQQGYYQQGDVIIQTHSRARSPQRTDRQAGEYVDYTEVK